MIKNKLFLLVGLMALLISVSGFTQPTLYFSTEEDFVSVTAGAVQIVSDGDLLKRSDGSIFMKNAELLQAFDEQNDLGLDAVDVIISGGAASDKKLVAFSTELDSSFRLFDAGDLLITNGGIIHNEALLYLFSIVMPTNIRTNLGLDAVQFVGDHEMIIYFLEFVASLPPNHFEMNPQELHMHLMEFQIEIWFSTEGTPLYPEKPLFLDGDLLSARDGVIIAANKVLLPLSIPAGLPDRGVDYGLDAVICPRTGDDNIRMIHFSTEILNYDPLFTDGDILKYNTPGVVLSNSNLISNFNSYTKFLGLDALSYWEK